MKARSEQIGEASGERQIAGLQPVRCPRTRPAQATGLYVHSRLGCVLSGRRLADGRPFA